LKRSISGMVSLTKKQTGWRQWRGGKGVGGK